MATQYGQGYGEWDDPGSGATAGRRHRLPLALRAPIEGRSWGEFCYLLLSLPIGITMFTYGVTMFSLGAGLLVTFLGIPVLAAALAEPEGSVRWSGHGREGCWGSRWPTPSRCG